MDRIIFDALGNIRDHSYGLRVSQRRLQTQPEYKGVTSTIMTDILSEPLGSWDSTFDSEATGGLVVEYYRNMISDAAIGQVTNYPFISSAPADDSKFIDMPNATSKIMSAGKVLIQSMITATPEFTALSCVHIVVNPNTWQLGRILPAQLPNGIAYNGDSDFVEYCFMLNEAKTKIVAFRVLLRAHTDSSYSDQTEFVLAYGYNRVEGSQLLATDGEASYYIRLRLPRFRGGNSHIGVIPLYNDFISQVRFDNNASTATWTTRIGIDYLPIPFCKSMDYPDYRGLVVGLAPDYNNVKPVIDVTSFLLDMKVAQRSSQFTVR